jgi:hypothetical protein
MSVKIGVIAEEQNDIDVLYELTCKLTAENNFSFRKRLGHGCGRLRRKCNTWSRNLVEGGCSHLVVIHDLDTKDEDALRKELEASVRNIAYTGHLILIPIYEIEAWLLSDPLALKQTFSMKVVPNIKVHPETIPQPKEYLRDIVWRYCRKRYVNTIHNKKIASVMQIERLSVCHSFLPYPEFLNRHINN